MSSEFTFFAEVRWETGDSKDEGAFLLSDGLNEFWVPKSQIIDKRHIRDSDYEFTIPEWLAVQKEIV